MSEPLNLFDLALEADSADPPGYRDRKAQLGGSIGAERLGGSVYELDPGESNARTTTRASRRSGCSCSPARPPCATPRASIELAEGDVVCFPVGPGGAHKVSNRSDAVVRVLMLSTMPQNELSVCIYPDSEKVGVWPWPGKRLRLSSAAGYWDGEV